jgi:hypothetical protein
VIFRISGGMVHLMPVATDRRARARNFTTAEPAVEEHPA